MERVMFAAFQIPLSWSELLKRTAKESSEDDVLGLAAQPADVLGFLEEQLRRISNTDSGGILTIGILGAIWSSSAAVVAIVGSLNRAYDIEEGHSWWKVRIAALPQPVTVFQASPYSSDRKLGIAVGLPLLATRLWNRLRRGREQGA
jgi:virulence factor BrkB